jgi:hypothetical protein
MHAFTDIHADFHPPSDSQHADSVICDILAHLWEALDFLSWKRQRCVICMADEKMCME